MLQTLDVFYWLNAELKDKHSKETNLVACLYYTRKIHINLNSQRTSEEMYHDSWVTSTILCYPSSTLNPMFYSELLILLQVDIDGKKYENCIPYLELIFVTRYSFGNLTWFISQILCVYILWKILCLNAFNFLTSCYSLLDSNGVDCASISL